MKVSLFAAVFLLACALGMINPVIGVCAYMANYIVAPDRQWWGAPLSQFGVRLSLSLAVSTAIGLAASRTSRKHSPSRRLDLQEILIYAFAVLVVASRLWGEPINLSLKNMAGTSEQPSEKIPKVAIFVFLMCRTMATYRQTRLFPWVMLIFGGLYTGLDAYTASPNRYFKGRLDILGGNDFRESSAVAAHLGATGAIIASLFLKYRPWWIKVICLVAGAFTVNALILTQTRSAMIGIAVGAVFAPLIAPRRDRLKIFAWLALGFMCAFPLTNEAFWDRAETIREGTEASAASRFDLWKAGFEMWIAYPMGVGAGSFYSAIGRFDPMYIGRDCHNTYIRCLAELGVVGFALFAALIVNAFRTLRLAARAAAGTPFEREIRWDCFGMALALIIYLVCGIFMGVTYIEELWWFLAWPVCLRNAAEAARQRRPISPSA